MCVCRYLEKGDREGTELELIRMAAKVRVTMRVPTCVSPSHSCTHTRYPCHLCCLHESYWRLTLLSLTQWTDQKVCLPHTRAHVHVYTHTQTQTHSLDSPTCASILKEVVAVWSVSTWGTHHWYQCSYWGSRLQRWVEVLANVLRYSLLELSYLCVPC